MIHHVVLFGVADQADIEPILEGLRGLRGQIPTLLDLQCGSKSFDKPNSADIVLITTHADAAGLAEYSSHPVHVKFLEWLGPRLSSRTVVDTDNLG